MRRTSRRQAPHSSRAKSIIWHTSRESKKKKLVCYTPVTHTPASPFLPSTRGSAAYVFLFLFFSCQVRRWRTEQEEKSSTNSAHPTQLRCSRTDPGVARHITKLRYFTVDNSLYHTTPKKCWEKGCFCVLLSGGMPTPNRPLPKLLEIALHETRLILTLWNFAG